MDRRRVWRLVIAAAVVMLMPVWWGVLPPGTLDPNGAGKLTTKRKADGRDIAFSLATPTNRSTTGSIRLVSASLISPHGMTLVGAYSASVDDRAVFFAAGPVPPQAGDSNDDQAMFNAWNATIPLDQTVLAPGQQVILLLIIHLAAPDDCVWMDGFNLQYVQYGRVYSVPDPDLLLRVYSGDDISVCDLLDPD